FVAAMFALASTTAFAETLQAEKVSATSDQGPPLYVFIYRAGPAWKPDLPMSEQGLRPHGLYIKNLFEKDLVFAGGGFVDAGGGMAIVRAASLEEAQGLLAADPAITSGIFTAEIFAWAPRFHDQSPLMPAN
ncbi:MAG: YciI family protein, partial [Parvularculaceae bacterium]